MEFEERIKTVFKKEIPLKPDMVVGQGFDNFIKMNFSKLEYEPVNFEFGVLEKKNFYSLSGYKRPSPSADEVVYGIKTSNWLLRLFVDELTVSYDVKTKKIKSFSGRSNILDDYGSPQDVLIAYEWKPSV